MQKVASTMIISSFLECPRVFVFTCWILMLITLSGSQTYFGRFTEECHKCESPNDCIMVLV